MGRQHHRGAAPARKAEAEAAAKKKAEAEAAAKKKEETTAAKETSSSSSGGGPLGKIFLASRPPGADVYVDGKSMGFKTPHWLEVPSGAHKITLKKGAQKGEKLLQITPGKNKSAYIVLK